MDVNIHAIPLGIGQCYIVQDQGIVAIDCGEPKKAKQFVKGMEAASIKPEDVKLIIVTHGHFDHIGSAAEIKEITGAPIAMHQREKEWLEKGLKPTPPGVTAWGRILAWLIRMLWLPFVHIDSTGVDVVLGDEPHSLVQYGIAGKVLHTPGHSPGSVSVVLDSGEAFVGDLAMNKFPLRFGPGLPIFAEDWPQVEESWKLLLEQGVKTIYPGHGGLFSIEMIQKALSL